jgi:hypothetical protein
VLQTASGETIPVVKEARVELTIGLDILRAYDASVDIGRRVLRLGRDEVPVREAPTASVLKRT